MSDATIYQRPAEADGTGGRPPVNIRLSVPMLRWRFYFAVTGGRERRGAERLAAERGRHPLRTPGNVLVLVAGAMLVYLATLGIAGL